MMSNEMWQVIQIMMWAFGIQTTVLIAIMGGFYSSLSKKIEKVDLKIDRVEVSLVARIDKLSEKVEDIDRRLCRIEGSLTTHGHCLFKQSTQDQKAL